MWFFLLTIREQGRMEKTETGSFPNLFGLSIMNSLTWTCNIHLNHSSIPTFPTNIMIEIYVITRALKFEHSETVVRSS